MPTSHVAHPNPINQFYQLDRDTPTGPWIRTTPWNDIIGGVDLDSADCMASEGVVILDAHTSGRIHSTPHKIRAASGDFVGGIGVDDVQRSARSLYDETILTPADFSRADVVQALHERRHVGFGVVYNALPDSLQLQLPGNFDHAIGADDIADMDGTTFGLIYDSLGTSAHWRPLAPYLTAAEALAHRVRGSAGQLFAMVSAVRPPLPSGHYRADLPEFPFWIYDVTGYTAGAGGGAILRRHAYERGGGSSVPVTVPPAHSSSWSSGPRRLVRITKGIYVNRYIAAAYARPA